LAGAAECVGSHSEEWLILAARRLWNTNSGPRERVLLEEEEHFRILLVDDDEKNLKLMTLQLDDLGYEVLQAKNGYGALSIARSTDIDLMLLDVMMPDMNGYEVCARIKAGEQTRHIPVVFLTALSDKEARLKGIEAGGDSFLVKPPDKAELAACLLSLIRTRTKNRTFTNIENVLYSLAAAVDTKDHYTRGHTDRVMNLDTDLAYWLSYTKPEVDSLRIAGLLHDIGKIGIPVEILNKSGPLSESEWVEMRKHPDLGFQICLPLKRNLGESLTIIRHHHEKLDGSSYPDGLEGDALSRSVRLMTIVDMYDALCTNRPYREALSREKTFAILFSEAEKGKIDKDIVTGLRDMLEYRDGTKARRRNEENRLYPNILIIENDPPNTKKLRHLLRNQKIRVFESLNAEDGIRMAYRHPPSLILFDMHLPGMDALTGVGILKKEPELRSIPIIIMGHSETEKEIEAINKAGCAGYVLKPIKEKEFISLILELLSEKISVKEMNGTRG
jgi:putative two-component system response regulator